ncbi:type 2 lanthipeptide synthetase LanM family protein [Actinokineospora bangkokensis]|uniref:Lantibiotic biosynthesis protein dehydration domain-containing protein n=1 Tax=Actinokineospora bangkokensis TaxID=1193682 RepID=A0A1Q9LK67_9PSEU|nr:type 2 lanthipeptide synthetase LanM family protein [Actinokineospora bangkokensis]OLR92410.1 hypothetical protein BJP25_20195 [Actinokineospora bangkokensis]
MRQTVESAQLGTPDVGAWWARASYPGEAPGRPAWVALVDRVLADLPETGERPEPDPTAAGDRVFAPVVRPFLAATRQLLAAGLEEVDLTGVDLAALWPGVEHWLTGRLTATASRTLVVRLHAAKRAGRLRGATGAERFTDFLGLLAGRAELAEVFDRHPVLARLLAEACLRTADAVVELLRRFAADRQALFTGLLAGGDPGDLVAVTPGSGDVHAGGRSVAVLAFSGGARLVYKPRPLGLQARWAELLDWFAGQLPELAPRAVRVLVREGYGWAEFIAALPCPDRSAVELFYRRQGALLALLYALDATDVHCENLIACAAEPVLVDVETLFHPAWAAATTNGPDPAMRALTRSVVRTALLPTLMLGEHGSLDVSAVGAGNDEPTPVALPRWEAAGTDAMRLARGRLPYAGGANRPVLDGVPVDATAHQQSLLSGFRVAYDLLVASRAELPGLLAGFAGEQVRLVMRPTQVYALLLAQATHPDHLVDGAARARAFAALAEQPAEAHQRPLARHEVRELLAGDVPLFTALVEGTDVRAAGGHRLRGLLVASGLEQAVAKVSELCAEDRREQEWLVSATLATKRPAVGHGGGGPVPDPPAPAVPDSRHLLALASGIGDDLVARSLQEGSRANWLGLELVDGKHWVVLPMGAGLAEGYTGTALFLAQLAHLTGTARYGELAARAVRGLPALVRVLAQNPELAREVGSGGYFGLGGIAYATARISRLLGDDELAECLPAAVAATAAAETGGDAGVGEGTAGALAAMQAVHAETGLPEAAELAARLAGELAERPLPAAAGFTWGRAGVHWALSRGERALADADAVEGTGWCSGLAGAVLAAGTAGDPGAHADRFVAAVAARPPRRDQSLCHGELGTLEALVVLAGQGHDGAARALRRAAARLIGAVEQHGVHCGTPDGVASPGLFTGTAGIGFGLLRLGFPERVPSVLLLQQAERT